MFIGVKKDALTNTPSPSGLRLRAFNSASMLTRIQLAKSAKTPRTPSRGLPTSRRALAASLIMFYNGDSPHTTSKAAVVVNVTSTSQGLEAIIIGSRGGQDLPINLTTKIENVNLKKYRSNTKGEHTTTIE